MLKKELPYKFRQNLLSIIQMGEIVYQDILKFQNLTFSSDYLNSMKSRIKTRIIYRQFDKDFLPTDFPFRCEKFNVNNFGDVILELSIGNVIIHFAYANKNGKLPYPSAYKKSKAIFNRPFDRQLMLNIESSEDGSISVNEKHPIKECPYYVLIVFGGKRSYEFVNMIVPSSDFTEISFSFDLKNEIHLVDKERDKETVHKRRVSLRDDILEQIKNESL